MTSWAAQQACEAPPILDPSPTPMHEDEVRGQRSPLLGEVGTCPLGLACHSPDTALMVVTAAPSISAGERKKNK